MSPTAVADRIVSSMALVRGNDVTYRQIDYWVRTGLVHPVGTPDPGSGSSREFTVEEANVVRVMAELVKWDMSPKSAATVARDLISNGVASLGPFEIKDKRS